MPLIKATHNDDHAPASGIANGDAGKFGEFAAGHQNRLFRFILKRVSNVSVAEDLTQEAFLQAYRNIGSFKGNSRLSTWVTGIGLNLSRNHLNRSHEHLHEMVSDEALFDLADSADNPLQAYEKKVFLKDLHGAISALPPELGKALLLVSLQGFSYKEASQAMGLSEGTVKSRVFRARERLRESMRGELFP